MSNKRFRKADRQWSSILDVRRRLITRHRKKLACYVALHRAGTYTDCLAQDRVLWWALVNTVMNLRVP
jgi:hypothetical protein